MKGPLVSIIIPCYNAAAFVGEAIESALSQEYRPKEVIVVDDGSSDDSVQSIKSFGERVRWKSTPNRGAPAARNEGLQLANGELVKFLDADDVLADDVLQRQVRQMKAECSLTEVPFGDIARIEEDGGNVTRKRYERFDDGRVASLMDLLKKNIQTSAPLHRRKHLLDVEGFDEDLWKQNEYDLHVRLHASGVRFRYFGRLCCYCRVHGGADRLSNQEPIATRPDSVRRWIQKRVNATQGMFEDGLPEEVRIHFAQSLWAGGRRALRADHPEAAERYFEDARQLSPEKCVNGSSLYRAGVRLLGPRRCESAKSLLETSWL